MNKHILLVMKWLNNKESVSKEELEKNKCGAACEHWAAYDDFVANSAPDDACDVVYAAAWAAYNAAAARAAAAAWAAYNAAAARAAETGHWVDKYFERTGEDKNEYLKELNK
jgi:hypothetical protein